MIYATNWNCSWKKFFTTELLLKYISLFFYFDLQAPLHIDIPKILLSEADRV